MASQIIHYNPIPNRQHHVLPVSYKYDSGYQSYNASVWVAHNGYQPIFVLPPEILVNIMQCALPDPPTLKSVMRFGAVCRKWRTIAWSYTELWSRICLNFQYCEYQSSRSPMDPADITLLQEWITRAGPIRPLLLHIKCTAYSLHSRFYECPFVEPTQLLTFLRYFPNRWKHLELCIPWTWFPFFQGLDFPQLKSIVLRPFNMDPRIPREQVAIGTFGPRWSASALQAVAFHGVDVCLQAVPWGQLQYIALYDTRPEGFLEVLPHCKNATEIKVSILWGAYQRLRSNPLPTPTQSDLPRLEHLLMFSEGQGFTVNVLSGMFAPRVQRITTNMFYDRLDGLSATFKSFVKRCKLRKLILAVNIGESAITKENVADLCARMTREVSVPIEFKETTLR